MTRRGPAGVAVALAAALAGCASSGDGEPARGGDPVAPGGSAPAVEAGPRRAAGLPHPGGVGHWSFLAASGRQALEEQAAAGDAAGFVEAPLTTADHMEVGLLVTRGRVPPPARPADEVLVVIELDGVELQGDRPCGALMVEGRSRPIAPGTIAVLPAGARGALELAPAARGGTLYVLVVRAVGAAPARAGGRAWLSDIGALDLEAAPRDPPTAEPSLVRVAGLGDRLGVHVLALTRHQTTDAARRQVVVEQLVPTQARPRHDEALLVLTGEGSVGLGDGGHRVQAGSLVLVPARLPFHMTHDSPPPGLRALVISVPARDGLPVELLDMPAGKTPVRREERREE